MTRLRTLLAVVGERLDRATLGRIAQSALAAGIAWELARQVPGHTQPFFAPIVAIIGLTAQAGMRARHSIRMLYGITLGIGLGAAIALLLGHGALELVLAVGAALLVTTAAGAQTILRSQAAISAALVVALDRPGQNLPLQRLIDSLIGGGVAIVFAQLLFPIDPVALVRRESQRLRDELAHVIETTAAALLAQDGDIARTALERVDEVDAQGFYDTLALARDVAHRAPRRRRARVRLQPLGPLAASLDAAVADARAIVTGALRMIDVGDEPRPETAAALRALAEGLRQNDPSAVRTSVDEARTAAHALLERDESLGASVLAHAVFGVADDLEGVAAAREQQGR